MPRHGIFSKTGQVACRGNWIHHHLFSAAWNAVISDAAVLEIRVAPAGCRAAVAMRMNRGKC